ncbi:type II toxin-antitoxin system RelE/ParE family toxin [Ottowia sp.]|uniref:type II toxin-antitoxin system RelE/ParE family toxin n=1 Tax=Ottowia sp. TaxID=1898956 RepID=UPI0039E3107F
MLRQPSTHRPVPDRPGEREAVIAFGSHGYVLRYRHDQTVDIVVVLRIWHQREQQG